MLQLSISSKSNRGCLISCCSVSLSAEVIPVLPPDPAVCSGTACQERLWEAVTFLLNCIFHFSILFHVVRQKDPQTSPLSDEEQHNLKQNKLITWYLIKPSYQCCSLVYYLFYGSTTHYFGTEGQRAIEYFPLKKKRFFYVYSVMDYSNSYCPEPGYIHTEANHCIFSCFIA